MDARKYLEQIEKIDKLIQNKKYEKDQWLSVAEGTSVSADADRVQSSGELHKMENAVIKAVELEKRIVQLEEEKQEIISTIEQLDVEHYDILHKRYVQYKSLDIISHESGYAWSTIKNKHKEALKQLQIILDRRFI